MKKNNRRKKEREKKTKKKDVWNEKLWKWSIDITFYEGFTKSVIKWIIYLCTYSITNRSILLAICFGFVVVIVVWFCQIEWNWDFNFVFVLFFFLLNKFMLISMTKILSLNHLIL